MAQGSRTIWWRVALAVLAGAALSLRATAGDDIALEFFIKAEVFAEFCDDLQLSEAQEVAATHHYGVYVAAMTDVNRRYLERGKSISDDVGWAPEGYIPPGYENFHPDHFRHRRFRLPEQHLKIAELSADQFAEALRDSRRLEQLLFGGIEPVLSAGQRELLPQARRALNRGVFFSVQRHERAVVDDLHATPNLHELVHQASKPDGELYRYVGDDGNLAGLAETASQVQAALDQFELEFDADIRNRFDRHIELRRTYVRAAAQDDQAAARELNNSRCQDWRQRHDIVSRAVRAIADALRAANESASAAAWLDRVHSRWYPVLFQQESSEALYHWLDPQGLDAELRAAVDEAFQTYVLARDALRVQAMAVGIEVRELGVDFFINGDDHERVVNRQRAIETRRRALCERTNAVFRSLLPTDEMKAAFDTRLQQFRQAAPSGMRYSPP